MNLFNSHGTYSYHKYRGYWTNLLKSNGDLKYEIKHCRCRIPECGEKDKSVEFTPVWLANAVPRSDSEYASCNRYDPLGENGTLDYCPAALFNQEQIIECDLFVYERDNTVVYDVSFHCLYKEWTNGKKSSTSTKAWLQKVATALRKLSTCVLRFFL